MTYPASQAISIGTVKVAPGTATWGANGAAAASERRVPGFEQEVGAMPGRPRTADEQADALAARLMKILDSESFLLELAAPHARTALQIADRLKRHAALFDVIDKKACVEPGQHE